VVIRTWWFQWDVAAFGDFWTSQFWCASQGNGWAPDAHHPFNVRHMIVRNGNSEEGVCPWHCASRFEMAVGDSESTIRWASRRKAWRNESSAHQISSTAIFRRKRKQLVHNPLPWWHGQYTEARTGNVRISLCLKMSSIHESVALMIWIISACYLAHSINNTITSTPWTGSKSPIRQRIWGRK
jgi:hypothetical protein